MFNRLDVSPAYKVVCDTIEREIVSGRLLPGRQLPTETELAEQFGLTRHTVREGLRILEQSGLVRREAGRRLFVSLPRYSEFAHRSARALIMQGVTYRELFEVSLTLELSSAEHAARSAGPEHLDRMERNLEDTQQAAGDSKRINELDAEFHRLVAAATRNHALMLTREPTALLFYPAVEKLFADPLNRKNAYDRSLVAHRRIIDALGAHDEAAAVLWTRRHMNDFKRGYEKLGIDFDTPVDMDSLVEAA